MTGLAAVRVGAAADRWSTLGFVVTDGAIRLANGAIELVDADSGIVSLAVTGLERPVDVDGLVFEPGSARPGVDQPNGGTQLDHVVVMTNSLERTSEAVADALGLPLRRIRETERVRQAFHRFADPADGSARGCILEIVEDRRVERSSFWGLVVIVDDLDAFCERAGELVSPPRPAVQPGRFIAGARRDADLGTAVAFMS